MSVYTFDTYTIALYTHMFIVVLGTLSLIFQVHESTTGELHCQRNDASAAGKNPSFHIIGALFFLYFVRLFVHHT